jgi:hypothetical protein
VRREFLISACLLLNILTIGIPALAHHGSGASYVLDPKQAITMTGTVTEFQWENPHVYILYDVKDAKGNVVNWGAETHAPVVLIREDGWSKDILKPGDEVTITAFPSKSGSPRGLLVKIVLNGKVLLDDGSRRNAQ